VASLCAAESDNVTDTTLCALYDSPVRYAGTFVRVRAHIIGRDLKELWIDTTCPAASVYMITLAELPENVRPKAPFSLELNSAFSEFKDALNRHVAITATLEGRFDPVFVWKEKKRLRVGAGNGFGKKHRYDARLVLRKISDVRTFPLPYK
jgi:hypothetical protein